MKIGISTTSLQAGLSGKPMDGIAVYTQSIYDAYQKMGLAPIGYSFPPNRIHALGLTLPRSFRQQALRAMLPMAKKLEMPLDIFHTTDYRAIPMSCPVVTTLYDAIPFVNPTMASSRYRRLKNYILRKSASYANHVIAISNFSIRELVEHYRIPEEKISVVYCGVDESWLQERPTAEQISSVLDKHNLSKGYFLTVGTIQPRKNLDRLLNAHDLLAKDIRRSHPIVIVGKQGWRCNQLITRILEKARLGEVIWLSSVDTRDELKAIYAGAEAFLFPSLYEGFGLPVLEAFAMRLPVLTSNTSSLPEVSNKIALEIDPLNVGEIADGMKHILSLPDRDVRIAAGEMRAKELSWTRCAEETLQVYRKVLSGR